MQRLSLSLIANGVWPASVFSAGPGTTAPDLLRLQVRVDSIPLASQLILTQAAVTVTFAYNPISAALAMTMRWQGGVTLMARANGVAGAYASSSDLALQPLLVQVRFHIVCFILIIK